MSFSYGLRKVLDGVSFDGRDGAIVSILGPNGVGKTTLLKCLCNIIKPQSGSVRVGGEDIGPMSRNEIAKRIGYVPQRASVSRSTVFDSVLIGRRPHMDWSLTKKDLQITRDAIRAVGISDISMRYVDEISGGEFQKVQIARAIVQEPQVLILDEPTSNLDVSNQYRTVRLIADSVRKRGVCTLMTMHDINLAAYCSDELLFMKEGRIVEHGPPRIITESLIEDVYGIEVDVVHHHGLPLVVPSQ